MIDMSYLTSLTYGSLHETAAGSHPLRQKDLSNFKETILKVTYHVPLSLQFSYLSQSVIIHRKMDNFCKRISHPILKIAHSCICQVNTFAFYQPTLYSTKDPLKCVGF